MLLCVFAIVLAVGIFLYSPVIFQEGNPAPQIKGIVRLNFFNKDIVKISELKNLYMTKSKNGQEVIKSFMKEQGYDFIEQMGSGYFFKNINGDSMVIVHKYYSRFYSLWSVSEIIKNKENSLADQLKECLSKSDMASHERCNELLKQITDFNSCVEAGFPIREIYPPQCATPDGRLFVEDN
jgi:predicted RNA binding protein YcfA (HicA-like mRNA interferase family)